MKAIPAQPTTGLCNWSPKTNRTRCAGADRCVQYNSGPHQTAAAVNLAGELINLQEGNQDFLRASTAQQPAGASNVASLAKGAAAQMLLRKSSVYIGSLVSSSNVSAALSLPRYVI